MTYRMLTTWITSAVVSAVVAVGAVAVTSRGLDAAPGATGATTSDRASATGATTAVDVDAGSDLSTDGLAAIATDARFSVSVLDETTGESATYGTGSFDTASIVKVDILAALLWQHQQAGTSMSVGEQTLAAAMIERSDNAAATTLFETIGGETGLEAFNAMIGLVSTDVGSGGYWGLTRTTAEDQVRLLQVVLGDRDELTVASRDYSEGLMRSVVDTQRFGVSAAADDPDRAAVKVGYLQRSATGLWDVTSIGEIDAGGTTYLVAILSDQNADLDAGADLVDEIARAVVGLQA